MSLLGNAITSWKGFKIIDDNLNFTDFWKGTLCSLCVFAYIYNYRLQLMSKAPDTRPDPVAIDNFLHANTINSIQLMKYIFISYRNSTSNINPSTHFQKENISRFCSRKFHYCPQKKQNIPSFLHCLVIIDSPALILQQSFASISLMRLSSNDSSSPSLNLVHVMRTVCLSNQLICCKSPSHLQTIKS